MRPRHAVVLAAAGLLAACGGHGEPAPATQAVAVEARAQSPAAMPPPAAWPRLDAEQADTRDPLFDVCMGRASVISMQQYVGADKDYRKAIVACHHEQALRAGTPVHGSAPDRAGIEPSFNRRQPVR